MMLFFSLLLGKIVYCFLVYGCLTTMLFITDWLWQDYNGNFKTWWQVTGWLRMCFPGIAFLSLGGGGGAGLSWLLKFSSAELVTHLMPVILRNSWFVCTLWFRFSLIGGPVHDGAIEKFKEAYLICTCTCAKESRDMIKSDCNCSLDGGCLVATWFIFFHYYFCLQIDCLIRLIFMTCFTFIFILLLL